ncbi:MAG: SurA N-terminal domain-containing protein [Pseudomonadota bacterium]
MLEFIRRGVKSIFAKILLGLLVLSFAVWGIGDIFSFSGATTVARVGEQEVTADQFADALTRNQARISREAGRLVSLAEMREQGFGLRVMGALLRDATLKAEAQMLGFSAPDSAVAEAIRNMEAFQGPDGEFSSVAYRAFLGQQNFSVPAFEELRRSLLEQQVLLNAIGGSGSPPPGVAPRLAAFDAETRTVETLRLGIELTEIPAVPGDEILDAFLADNDARFREPERKTGAYIHVDIDALAAGLLPDEAAVREAYDAEIDRFVAPAEASISQLNFPSLEDAEAAGITDTVGFEAAVEARGLTAEDAALGLVGEADLPPALADAVFTAEGPGVVGPVETPLGAAVILVETLQKEAATPFEEVREDLAQTLALTEAYGRAPEIAGEIEELRASGLTLAEIAEEVDGVTGGTLDGWAANGTLAGGALAPGVLSAGPVRIELLQALDGEERELVELEDGGYFLTRIDAIEPAYLPELDDIRGRVAEAWVFEEQLRSLERSAGNLVGVIGRGTGATLTSMAAGLSKRTAEVGPFLRSTPPDALPVGMTDEIFALAEGGIAIARADDGESVVIAQLVAIDGPEPDRLAAAAEQLETALATSIARDVAEYFSRAAEADHGTTVDQTAVGQVYDNLGAAHAGRAHY